MHGLSHHPVYQSCLNARRRCYDINFKNYKDYGGRGIRFSKEFEEDFGSFVVYCFPFWKPGTTVERIDLNKGYERGNISFVTRKEQMWNRRNTVMVEYQGKITPLPKIAYETNIPITYLYERHRRGVSIEEIVIRYSQEGTRKKNKYKSPEEHLRALYHGLKGKTINSNHNDYSYYGAIGRGLSEEFLKDVDVFIDYCLPLYIPNMTVERLDNNKGYERGNIEFASRKTQARNRGNTIRCEYRGEIRVLAEIAETENVNYFKLYNRVVRRRLSVEESLAILRNI